MSSFVGTSYPSSVERYHYLHSKLKNYSNLSKRTIFSMKLRKTIVLKGTMDCNLRCKYCYEFRQNGEVYSKKTLSSTDAVSTIKRFAKLFPDAEILWLIHGGEPLLRGVEYFEKITETIRFVNENYNVNFKIAIQTNGTLLTNKWIEAFEKNIDVFGERIISVSIDGPESINGNVRVSRSGQSAHSRIVSGIERIKNSSLDFTTISVVGEHNIHKPQETYEFIKYLNPNFAKFIPCYNHDKHGNKELFGITPLEYSNFICRIFDLWIKDLKDKKDNRFIIDPIISVISKLTDIPVTWCEFRASKCENFTSIYPDGEMWLCDAYDHDKMRKTAFIGNILTIPDEQLKSTISEPCNSCNYNEFYKIIMDECLSCEIYKYCSGGCVEKRQQMMTKSHELSREYCQAKKDLIYYIKRGVDHALS